MCVYYVNLKCTYKGLYFVIDDKFIIILKKFPDKYTTINLYTTIHQRTTQHSIEKAINESPQNIFPELSTLVRFL